MNLRSSANQRRHREIGGHTRFKRSRYACDGSRDATRRAAVRAPTYRQVRVRGVRSRAGVGGFLSLNFAHSTLGVVRIVNSVNRDSNELTMKLDALHRFTQYCAASGITSPLQLQQCPVNPSNRYMTSPGQTVMTPTTPLVVTPLAECILGESADDLAAKLLEKYEATDSPYFDILPPIGDPASFETLPHRWTDAQLAHVERLCDDRACEEYIQNEQRWPSTTLVCR